MTSATNFNRSPIKLGVRGTIAARMESAGAIIPGIALASVLFREAPNAWALPPRRYS